MAHGTRNRVWRVAVAGVGALLCGGLVGCMNTDKPKDKVQTKPGVGLPGTPTLPPGGTAKTGAPTGTGLPTGNFTGAGAGLQQPRTPTGANTTPGTGGTGIQQTGGFGTGTQPGLGAGGVSAPTPPANLQPGGPPAPSMSWPTNYPPTGSGPANPVLPPMTDITPPGPIGASGAPVTPPQPVPGAQTGLGPVAPLGGPG